MCTTRGRSCNARKYPGWSQWRNITLDPSTGIYVSGGCVTAVGYVYKKNARLCVPDAPPYDGIRCCWSVRRKSRKTFSSKVSKRSRRGRRRLETWGVTHKAPLPGAGGDRRHRRGRKRRRSESRCWTRNLLSSTGLCSALSGTCCVCLCRCFVLMEK